MKAYDQLTRLGRIRRMRPLAQKAVEQFGVSEAKVNYIRLAGNTLYRVVEAKPKPADDDIFMEGHYLLRVHQPGYQDPKAIALELDWLASLRRETGLPVPEPVPAKNGEYLIELSTPEIPDGRYCSLLKWVRGRLLKNPRPKHYYSQGQLFAGMHRFAETYSPANPEVKRRLDWFGLFQDDSGCGIPSSEVWGMFPKKYLGPFSKIVGLVKDLMAEWGTGPRVFGLIHGDLGADANGIFYRDQARAIDFDDSGFGYYIYDLSVALEHIWDHENYASCKNALVEGYLSVRPVPQEQIDQLELFLAALNIYISLWAQGSRDHYPKYWESDLLPRIERAAKYVDFYLTNH